LLIGFDDVLFVRRPLCCVTFGLPHTSSLRPDLFRHMIPVDALAEPPSFAELANSAEFLEPPQFAAQGLRRDVEGFEQLGFGLRGHGKTLHDLIRLGTKPTTVAPHIMPNARNWTTLLPSCFSPL
jgi:hypothetical protein